MAKMLIRCESSTLSTIIIALGVAAVDARMKGLDDRAVQLRMATDEIIENLEVDLDSAIHELLEKS